MDSSTTLVISFAVYSLGIILFGLYSTKLKKRTSDDFVLANRELGPWASSLSASASSESGWVMLGLVGEAYAFGLAAIWIIPGIAAGYLFNWFVIAERMRSFTARSGAVTLTQFIAHRYDRNSIALKIIPVVIISLAMLGYVAAQMNAAGKAFEATFDLDYTWGVLVGAAIILTYTVSGGFRAICWTDIIQAGFMVVALIGMPLIAFVKIGSLGAVTQSLQTTDPGLMGWAAGKAGMAGLGFVIGLLGIGLGYPGMPHVLARFMAAKDSKTVDKAAWISMAWFVLVYVGAVAFGLMARVLFGDLADPEQALPIACNEFLPPVLAGFVIAAIVSAICSTADSQLLVVSSTISRDVVPLFSSKSRDYLATVSWDRWTLVIIAILSIAFALTKNRVIFEFVLYSWSVLGASFGPVVILGLLWRRTTKAGAISGMLTGLVVSVIWRNTPALKAVVYELVPAFLLALAAVVIVSLLTHASRASDA
ncbi:MAG: sodium/proline symporter [bacterium]